MVIAIGADIPPRHLAQIINPPGLGITGAGVIDRAKNPCVEHEPVPGLVILIISGNVAAAIDACGQGGDGIWKIDSRKRIAAEQETVFPWSFVAGREIRAHDVPAEVDADCAGERGPRERDRSEGTIDEEEPMIHSRGVDVATGDLT